MRKALTDEERERQLAEDIWLNYFNRFLFENGTISEKEYKKMTELIAKRRTKSSPHRTSR